MADRSGLTAALKDALERQGRFPEADRGVAMVSAVVMIALGGRSMSGSRSWSTCPWYWASR